VPTGLELKGMLKALEARVSELEKRPTAEQMAANVQQLLDSHFLASKPLNTEVVRRLEEDINRQAQGPVKQKKLCPKCNVVPAYFFHVRNCRGP
jgi:hypothetical protein